MSVIIPTCNDRQNFEATFNSVKPLLKNDLVEVIVIDSSEHRVEDLVNALGNVDYYWVPPCGVYQALNFGIDCARSSYLMTLNAGDCLLFDPMPFVSGSHDVYLFDQEMISGNQKYIYRPKLRGIWPHQSVIYRRSFHQTYGKFDTAYKIISDQLFFQSIQYQNIKYVSCSLTRYLGNGMSEKVKYSVLKEIYILNRALGRGVVFSFIKATLFPIIRKIMVKLNPDLVLIFRKWVRND